MIRDEIHTRSICLDQCSQYYTLALRTRIVTSLLLHGSGALGCLNYESYEKYIENLKYYKYVVYCKYYYLEAA